MNKLIKKVITEYVFRENTSDPDDIRCLTLRYDSEGAGRFFVLTSNIKGSDIYLSTPEDFLILYEAAKEMWDQGSIFVEEEGW